MADLNKYVTATEAREKLQVSNKTLRGWANTGKIDYIRTEGGWRRYDISKYMKENNLNPKRKVCYARVSSYSQKDDLKNQVKYLQKYYPRHEIIQDVGSGINFKRKGLRKIIEYSINNELGELVVTHKDRLCRIGFELIEFILEKYSKTEITIINDKYKPPEAEMTEDLLEIMTVYSSKLHGSRTYKK